MPWIPKTFTRSCGSRNAICGRWGSLDVRRAVLIIPGPFRPQGRSSVSRTYSPQTPRFGEHLHTSGPPGCSDQERISIVDRRVHKSRPPRPSTKSQCPSPTSKSLLSPSLLPLSERLCCWVWSHHDPKPISRKYLMEYFSLSVVAIKQCGLLKRDSQARFFCCNPMGFFL